MPIFALYNFDDIGLVAADTALENGNQDGAYFDGATATGGRAVLDGVDDKIKIYPNSEFQSSRGTLEIQFSQAAHLGREANTVLSRDTRDETQGGYRIEVMLDGSILISHESDAEKTTFKTDIGFVNAGDEINIVYSWDVSGGGSLQIRNLTRDETFADTVPAGLSMDQGATSQPWMIGAGQSFSDPDALNNLNAYFNGSVEMFSLSDTVDNCPSDSIANPNHAETDGDTVVDTLVADNGSISDNPDGALQFENTEEISGILCFTPGTMIATPRGEVPVERLRADDRVITRDNGIQELRWVGQRNLDWAALTANPHLRPIMIRRGSLGNDLPERDMMLSPNHRVLVSNDRTSLYFDEHEVLVAAKHLVGGKGIFEVESIGTSYIHLMFDQHEVVLSDGAWTESFQPGDFSLNGMGNAQRSEIFELFPALKTQKGLEDYSAARRILKKHEARLLIR